VETSITTKGSFGIVNKSESDTILAILRANRFTITRSVKTINNIRYVGTRAKAFRSVNLLHTEQNGVLRNVSSYEGIKRLSALGQLLLVLETIGARDPLTSFPNQPWSCVVHPSNPDWKEMNTKLHVLGADISFLQPCTDVPHLCFA